MRYNIQSDKNIKIFTKVNVFTNVNFKYDISLDLNKLNIKKNQNYLFSTYFINLNNQNISSDILNLCEQKNYINLIILNEDKNFIFKKFINLMLKFHKINGKKIILISKKNFFNKVKEKEFIYFVKNENLSKKKFLSQLSKKILEV